VAKLRARFEADEAKRKAKVKASTDFSATAKQSTLEKMAGKRHNPGMTLEEQVEKFPFLKNAPLEGAYAAGVKVRGACLPVCVPASVCVCVCVCVCSCQYVCMKWRLPWCLLPCTPLS
jgi:hypothetical protein